jgi:hypothetical protein
LIERWSGVATIVAGIAWTVSVPLVATAATEEPVGLGYDDYNRLLTLPLALLIVALAGLRALQLPELSAWGRRGAVLGLVGAGLLLLGNVIEFWAVLLTDDAVFAIAEDRGLDEWAGSTVGWLTFLVGAALLFVGGSLFGASTASAGILPRWAGLVIALTTPLMLAAFVAWSSSLRLTAVLAGLLGLGWIALGALLLAAIEVRRVA